MSDVTMPETAEIGASAGADPGADNSVDPAEIDRFAAIAAEWWDPEGKFRPLHRLNPVRLEFIRDRLAARFGRDPLAQGCLDGLDIVDVGCGGGLVCEPLTRLGAKMTGIDATEKTVSVAQAHAAQSGLAIDYRLATAEQLVAAGETFDAVLALEVVEHVTDPVSFLATCCQLTRPGGALVLSTLNRTPKAFAFGIVGAEYVMRWLPRGTHQWRKFVRPSELSRGLTHGGARIEELTGVSYDPLTDGWRLSKDLAVNYMAFATRD